MPQIGDNQMAKAYIGGLQMNGTSDEPSDYVVYGLKMDEWDSATTEWPSVALFVNEVQVPDTITSVGDEGFKGLGVSELNLPSGVTSIGNSALSQMPNLTSFKFGYLVDWTGDRMFKGDTSLTGITIESGVVEHDDTEWGGEIWYEDKWANVQYGDEFFSGCTSLTGVPITDRLYNIGKNCFTDCESLTEFTFPSNISNFGVGSYEDYDSGVFEGTSLSSVTFNENQLENRGGYIKLPKNCFKNLTNLQVNKGPVGDYSYEGCTSLTSYTETSKVDKDWEWQEEPNYGIPGVFKGCTNLKSVTVRADEDGKVKFGKERFNGCTSLSSVTVNVDEEFTGTPVITEIGDDVFNSCTSLSGLPYTITAKKIGNNAFSDCSALTGVSLSGVEKIGNFCFYGNTSLTGISLSGMSEIGYTSFANCSALTSVEIPDSLSAINDYTFSGCSGLSSITIPDNIKTISAGAFASCRGLKSVTFGSGLTSIGMIAFQNCGNEYFSSITIPDNVKSLGIEVTYQGGPFKECWLKNIEIGTGCTFIQHATFYATPRFDQTFTIHAVVPPNVNGSYIFSYPNIKHIYVPAESVDAYKAATNWSAYANFIEAIPAT